MRRNSPSEPVPAAKGPRNDWQTILSLLPYLTTYKWRVAFALSCLIGAKVANLGVPIVMKKVIDSLSSIQHLTALGRAQVVQWLAFEQERVMGGIGGARFRLITGRATAEQPLIAGRLATAREALDVLAAQLVGRDWLVGDRPTIADVAVFAYTSRAGDIDLDPADWPPVAAWLDRVRALPGFVDDFASYPHNARAGAGTSIYG